MTDTTRGSRNAAALAILALGALLVTPFLFQRTIERRRDIITVSLEPARAASSNARLAIAREVGAIRGFLLTRDSGLLVDYRAARKLEKAARQQLGETPGLDSTITARARRLDEATTTWNSFNDLVAAGAVAPADAVKRLRDQQTKYRATLDASEALDASITAAVTELRRQTGVAERRWAVASFALALLAALAAGLVITMLRSALQENTLARTDPLTGLYNRRGFDELARRELSRATRNASALTVVVLDLDGFKQVNDKQGHAAGDRLLRCVSEGIGSAIRDTDVGARLGGDEFAVLLPDNRADPPERAVERVRDVILDYLRHEKWQVTLSIGAVTIRGGHHEIDALLHDADRLMYRVKNAGKSAIQHASREPTVSGR